MTKNEFEWLNEDWEPDSVVHHSSKGLRGKIEMSNEQFDDWFAKNLGYDNIHHLNKHNIIRDKLCLAAYGNNCLRNK